MTPATSEAVARHAGPDLLKDKVKNLQDERTGVTHSGLMSVLSRYARFFGRARLASAARPRT